ncbi:TonB-dependent receptor [Novosphingobium sp. SL115]|uniref:TonB-dependent receptor n=1 Tax=Novosphingobium sp. SL115 TaxID=2995150 RepID=UPI002273C453|nr:TonB-dependent receptor [Novosphingobium sp. SL115]MCY1673076.1 TonB-dependent receptor [Novosphingobium sp. SL115]
MLKATLGVVVSTGAMAVATLGWTAPAFAADQAQAEEGDAAIIVTARKREENLIDVPLPVTVATQAQLQRDQVYSITDLQRTTASLEISQTSGGEVNGGARLRGLGTGVFNASVSPSVAFVVDQVPQGNLTFPLLFDLAQVEVLRGPQGTLFGQGASAGVINITTVAPSTDAISVSGGINAADKGTAGSEVSELTVRGGINVPLGDKAAVRIAGQYKREAGLQRNTFLDLDNRTKEYGVRGKLLLKPSETVTINLSAEMTEQKVNGWNFFAIAIAPNGQPNSAASTGAFTAAAGCDIPEINARAEFYCEDSQATMRNSAQGFSGVIDLEINDNLSLTSVTAYRMLDRETDTVNFSRRLVVAARNENIESESKQFSQELRLDYQNEGLNVLVGALYSKFDLETTPINGTTFGNPTLGNRTGFSVCHNQGFFCPVPVSFSYEDTSNRIFALFSDVTVPLTEQLDLFGGLRYSSYRNSTGVGVNTLTASRTVKIEDNDVSGRVGLSFKPTPDSTIFVSYARGYKPPAVVVPTIATDPVVQLKPEKADAIEFGAKVQVGRVQLSGNAFWNRVKNFQTQSSVFNASGALISVTQNIDKVVSKGFELNAMGTVVPGLTVNAGYQFNDVRFPTGFVGNDGVSLSGKQFINAPKHKFTISTEYSAAVSGSLEAFINANLVYKSAVLLGQYGNDVFRYPGHELVNAGFGVRDAEGKWSASIFARNLTKEREPTAYLASDFGGSADGGIRAWPAAGITARVVGLTVDFNF